MRLVFFSFYYPPDLSAGSFRSAALSKALSEKIQSNDEIHIITTQPNRYLTHRLRAPDNEIVGNITVHRVKIPSHRNIMIFQAYTFSVFAISAFNICRKLKPDFLIGTTSRLMTGALTWISAKLLRRKYYIDMRDIFSETISDLFAPKSKFISFFFSNVFCYIDKKMLNSAEGVNVVSEGFPEYFQKQGINTTNWSFFPNGVDEEFLNILPSLDSSSNNIKTILYAGNIGSGQGLELVIPNISKQLGESYRFLIIGDGGSAGLLNHELLKKNISNVKILPPVSRSELIKYYMSADILFLHLNNIPAFQRVLPSKIFEYIALKKPIIAGLSGYSAKFLKSHASYAHIFHPGDFKEAVNGILNADKVIISEEEVSNFLKTFARAAIMDKMSSQLIYIIESSR